MVRRLSSPTRHERRRARRRLRLILATLAVCIGVAVLLILVVQGTSGLVRFFTVPSLKAPSSGKKYTPTGAIKRYFEKRREKQDQE